MTTSPQGTERPPLTDEELAAIRKRAIGATPGPWTRFGRSSSNPDGDDEFLGHEIEGPPRPSRGQFARVADAEFIAHARTDVPTILAKVDRLRAELADAPSRRDLLVAEERLRSAELGQHKAEVERDALAAKLAAGDASDGYHTHNELYDYRMLYNAHAARGWLAEGYHVVKSWKHSDGEKCFGGGWFVVTAELPTGQVSNHYEAQHWALFDVPQMMPPEWDGHTPADAADRLRAALGEDGGTENA
jgi:hypothetical protein